MNNTNGRDEWVSYFDGRGIARHVPSESSRGRAVLAELAAARVRHCSGPGCSQPLTGRAGRKYCSDKCRQAAGGVGAVNARAPRNGGFRLDMADTPLTRSAEADLPATTRADIAHTANTSDAAARRCANCGRDIGSKRAGAVVCSNACRMAVARRAARLAGQIELTELLEPTSGATKGGTHVKMSTRLSDDCRS